MLTTARMSRQKLRDHPENRAAEIDETLFS